MIKRVFLLTAGFCRHPECVVIRGGSVKSKEFPASVVVIEHAQEGVILFDTGYSHRFHDATRSGIERLYAWTTPMSVRADETAASQLSSLGLKPNDVRVIILSHFHADHIAGVGDFPRARLIYKEEGWQKLSRLNRVAKLCRGFLPGLLPADFRERSSPFRTDATKSGVLPYKEFSDGYDIFGDQSVLAVDLPGHAIGQIGIVVDYGGHRYFFVADAAWTSLNIAENRPPSRVAHLIMDDYRKFHQTLARLHHLQRSQPLIKIVPCHCRHSLESLTELNPYRASALLV